MYTGFQSQSINFNLILKIQITILLNWCPKFCLPNNILDPIIFDTLYVKIVAALLYDVFMIFYVYCMLN